MLYNSTALFTFREMLKKNFKILDFPWQFLRNSWMAYKEGLVDSCSADDMERHLAQLESIWDIPLIITFI